MRILCRSGHFAFYPQTADELGQYVKYLGATLEAEEDYYTFPALVGLPRWSLAVLPFGNLPAVKTFEGKNPWDVMKENEFVFSTTTGLLVPKLSIVSQVSIGASGFYFRPDTRLIQPGAFDGSGGQIMSYDAIYEQDYNRLKVLEYDYE